MDAMLQFFLVFNVDKTLNASSLSKVLWSYSEQSCFDNFTKPLNQ